MLLIRQHDHRYETSCASCALNHPCHEFGATQAIGVALQRSIVRDQLRRAHVRAPSEGTPAATWASAGRTLIVMATWQQRACELEGGGCLG